MINIIEGNQFIADIIQFHNERNLIIDKRKRRINEKNLNLLRLSVIKLIEAFEKYMELPIIIENQDTDFSSNIIGIALEYIPGGSWGRFKLYKSFSEMVHHINKSLNNDN